MYKVVINDNYLCHFNQNHSKKNGQFTSGDGDGDGITNDHANQNKKGKKKSGVISGWETDKTKLKKTRQKIIADQKAKRKKMTKGQKVAIGLGVATAFASSAALGIQLAMDYRKEKVNRELNEERVRRARDYVERQKQMIWREAASKAKFVGGDW